MASDGFVRIRDLRKRFGALAAVDGVSLDVAEGHTLALLGPSGCGKTTILRCIAGLEAPDEGLIEIAGAAMFDRAAAVNLMPEQRKLGIVFQSYAVWPHMSVAENVGFPLKVRGVAKAEQRGRVEKILALVGLSASKDKSATQLSGGQQQRVALARALVHEPRVVLFDEPMSNLDAQLREHMRMELMVLQARLGFTAIYVTHDQAEAFALAETVVVMNRGKVETAGAPREVFHRPQTPFVARFLGLNVVPGRVVRVGGAAQAGAAGEPGRRYAQVALGDGFALWGAIGHDRPLEIGAPALACMRKEHIAVRSAGENAGAAGAQTFSAEIKAASFLGLQEEYIVAAGPVELRAIQGPGSLKAGDRVTAAIRPQDCIVFLEQTVPLN
jgi:ABC-type Fe3+/spermidine/putrescine transport system ATPase subunit